MKKLIVVALFLSVVALPAFTREATIAELIEKAVSKLDRPVPTGFQRMGASLFVNDNNVMLVVMNGLVFKSFIVSVFETGREALIEAGRLHDFFEDSHNNWIGRMSSFNIYHESLKLRTTVFVI